jgi:hypothetical protein
MTSVAISIYRGQLVVLLNQDIDKAFKRLIRGRHRNRVITLCGPGQPPVLQDYGIVGRRFEAVDVSPGGARRVLAQDKRWCLADTGAIYRASAQGREAKKAEFIDQVMRMAQEQRKQ